MSHEEGRDIISFSDLGRQRPSKRRKGKHVSETENLGVDEETYESLLKDYEEYGGEA